MKKDNKGITMIAMVITVILVIILAGASVAVFIRGDLFNNAKEAGAQTQYEAEKEQLIDCIVKNYDENIGKIDIENFKKELEEDNKKWKDVSYDDEENPTYLLVVGVESNEQHTINIISGEMIKADGEIIIKNNN